MAGGFDARIVGVEKLEKLGRDLKEAGDKDLRKELLRAGQRITKPAKQAFPDHARSDLPSGGGLNDWVATRMKTSTQVRLSGRNVGVRLKTKHPSAQGLSDLPAINRGALRKPLYGNRKHWYLQMIPPGFADRAADDMGDICRDEFLQAVDDVAAKLRAKG